MKRIAINAALVVGTLAVIALLWRWRAIAVLFLASLAVGSALRPLADRLVERGWRGRMALGAAYLLSAVITVLLVIAVLDPLSENLVRLPRELADAHAIVLNEWPNGSRFDRFVAEQIPSVEGAHATLTSLLGERPERWLMLTTVDAFAVLANIVFVFVLSLYWSLDRVHFERLWLSMAPVEERGVAREVWREIDDEIGAYVRSEVVQTVGAVLLLGLGLFWIGHPYPALVACIGALAWMIPWFGGPLSVAVAMAMALPLWASGQASMWGVVISSGVYTAIVLVFLEFVVEPRFFDRQRYNSLFVIVAAIGLVELFGWVGLIFAPPIAAALQIAIERIVAGRRATAPIAVQSPVTKRRVRARLRALRAELDQQEEPRPNVVNLIDRLEHLAAGLDDSVLGAGDRPTSLGTR